MEVNKAAIGQALAKHSIEIVESTANGYGLFKDSWDAAVEGNSNYKAFFTNGLKQVNIKESLKG